MNSELNEEQLEIKCENEWLQKEKSCMLQKECYSWQKLQGMKMKNQKSKWKERNSEISGDNTPSTYKSSMERVRKHTENKRLIVSIPFKLPRLHENLDVTAAKLRNIYQQLQTVK